MVKIASSEKRLHALADQRHQFRVHERVIVRDVEHLDAQVVEEIWELLPQPLFVFMLHDEYLFGPDEKFLANTASSD